MTFLRKKADFLQKKIKKMLTREEKRYRMGHVLRKSGTRGNVKEFEKNVKKDKKDVDKEK